MRSIPHGTRGPAALRPSPWPRAGSVPSAAEPHLSLQRDLVALQVLPAGALLQQLCPQLVDLGTRTRHGLVLPHPSPPRSLGERLGPPRWPWLRFLPVTPVLQSTGGLGAPNSRTVAVPRHTAGYRQHQTPPDERILVPSQISYRRPGERPRDKGCNFPLEGLNWLDWDWGTRLRSQLCPAPRGTVLRPCQGQEGV